MTKTTTAGMRFLGTDGAAGDETAATYWGGKDGRLYLSVWGDVEEVNPLNELRCLRERIDAATAHIAVIERAATEGQYGPGVTAAALIPGDYERREAARRLMGAVKSFVEGGEGSREEATR